MKCTRCGRRLTKPGVQGMGPVCARAVLGSKPKRQPSQPLRDEMTADLFAPELEVASRVHSILEGVSLEMR